MPLFFLVINYLPLILIAFNLSIKINNIERYIIFCNNLNFKIILYKKKKIKAPKMEKKGENLKMKYKNNLEGRNQNT